MKEKISLREYLVMLFVALMSPLIKVIPGYRAEQGGVGGWLSALVSVVPVLIVVWVISAMGRSLPEDAGLGEVLCLGLGKPVGRVLCVVYGLWLMLWAVSVLRFCVERFTSTIYPDTGLGLFLLVILLLGWWLGRQKLPVLARVGQIFFFAIVLTLGSILILGVGKIHLYNVWPVWTEDVPKIVKGCLPIMGILGIGVGGMFLFGQVTDRRDGLRLTMGWVAGLCLLMTALGFVVLGNFGPAMAGRLQVPFFSLAKEVTIEGAVERMEPLVVAMWVFADVVLLGVLFRAAEKAFVCAIGGKQERVLSPLLLIALPGAELCAGSSFALEEFYGRFFSFWDMMLFFVVPFVALAVGKLRKAF